MALTETQPEAPEPREIFDSVLAIFGRHYPEVGTARLERAYEVASAAHAGQLRQTGDAYVSHPLIVAEILAELGLDEATLIAAFLHDTVEDTEVTFEFVAEEFGEEVAGLIDGVTKLDRLKFSSREEQQAATIRKMAIAMAKDIRVLLIKLADRLHNMRTLDPLPIEKQERVSSQTLEVYAPLAHRLGCQEIKHELEDRCFAVLYPKRRAELEKLIKRRTGEREEYVNRAREEINESLRYAGIEAEVTGRPKHLYSIYKKMIDSGLAFDQIHDLIGVRILVKDVKDCYGALGLVHTIWRPVHGRFKDYIAMPKFNLYQSLHTTVVGPDGRALEVQIRTREMHDMAEYGIAAHWRYKEGVGPADIPFIADLRYLQEEHSDPTEFLASLKLDLYRDEVFVLTPGGDVFVLPAGATPVDFAYRVHTDVGHRCVGAKVNGRLVPLADTLESGDIVEIITSKAQDAHPTRDWLDFVASSRAASKIRQWFTRERREVALSDGRDFVMKSLRRENVPVPAAHREALLKEVAADLGYADLDALFVAVGDNHLSATTVANRLTRTLVPSTDDVEQDLLEPPRRRQGPRPTRGISVEGMDDMLVRIARCCAPVPGDDIMGFVTVGRGVSVHRTDCTNFGALEERAERMIEVSWAAEHAGSFFVWIQVESLDRPGLLMDVTTVLSDLGANIHASSSGTGRDRVAILRYEVEVSDPQLLERLLTEIRNVNGVFDAYRLVPRTENE